MLCVTSTFTDKRNDLNKDKILQIMYIDTQINFNQISNPTYYVYGLLPKGTRTIQIFPLDLPEGETLEKGKPSRAVLFRRSSKNNNRPLSKRRRVNTKWNVDMNMTKSATKAPIGSAESEIIQLK